VSSIRAVRRRHQCALALIVLAGLAACSGDDDATVGSAPSAATPTTSATDGTSDGTTFDFTPTITITDDGFLPLQAVAVFGETLTFVNDTERAQTIHFTNGSPEIGGADTIGPIQPGASMTYPRPLETAISLVYEADSLPGFTGRLQIDPGVGTL
jgi:hypothetical protein